MCRCLGLAFASRRANRARRRHRQPDRKSGRCTMSRWPARRCMVARQTHRRPSHHAVWLPRVGRQVCRPPFTGAPLPRCDCSRTRALIRGRAQRPQLRRRRPSAPRRLYPRRRLDAVLRDFLALARLPPRRCSPVLWKGGRDCDPAEMRIGMRWGGVCLCRVWKGRRSASGVGEDGYIPYRMAGKIAGRALAVRRPS